MSSMYLKLIFLFLLSFKALALESTDVLSTQILKIYSKNILVVNRGLEDAIYKADHAKFTSDDGFIARGICLKADLQTSHWKIYRVVRPQLVSKDTVYKLSSMNQSKIPPSLLKYSKVDFSDYYNDVNSKTESKQLTLQQDRIANYDLPNEITDSYLYKKKKKSKFDNFINKNFSNQKLKEDLEDIFVELFVSPISVATRFDQKEVHYGLSFFNLGVKYQFSFNAIETQRKIIDPVSREGYQSKSTHYDSQFQFNHLTESFSLLSFIEYDREKIGATYYPYDYYQLGLLGVKLHLIENDPRSSLFDISYTPTFESITFSNPGSTSLDLFERQGVRHRFKIRMYGNLSKELSNKTEIVYAPMSEFASSNFGFEDTYVNGSTKFSYALGKSLFWDYILEYENDELRGRVYGFRSDNTIQTFRIRYLVDL